MGREQHRSWGAASSVVLGGVTLACLLALASKLSAQDNFDLDAPEQAPPAEAEPPPSVQRSPIEVAREHMERGQALYGAQRYIESAEEFLRAYEAQPFSAFLYNAGVSYEKVDDPGRAADYFSRFLQTDPQATNASKLSARIDRLRGLARAREAEKVAEGGGASLAELEAARAQLAEVQGQLAALGGKEGFKSLLNVQSTPGDAEVVVKSARGDELFRGNGARFTQTLDPGSYIVQVTHPRYSPISAPITVAPAVVNVVLAEMSQGQFLGYLRVQSDVPGASVFLDERGPGALGRTPFQNAVKVGKHHVWIDKPGYKPVERDIDVGVGDDPLLKVSLERVDFGRIRVVASRPDAEVYVDGKRIGRVPIETDVAHGQHTVKVSAEGMKDWKQDVQVQRGQATPLRVRLRPKVGRAGAWVTAGVAAGVLGGSIAAALIGKKLGDDMDADREAGTLRSDDDRADKTRFLYIGADAGFGVTAGLAALATYYFLRDPLPDSEGRVLEPRDWASNSSRVRGLAHFDADLAPDRIGGRLRWSF
jgi:PEGA domain